MNINIRSITKTAAAVMSAVMFLCGCTAISSGTDDVPPAVTIIAPETQISGTDPETPGVPHIDTDSNYIYWSLTGRERKFYDELKAAAEAYLPAVTYSSDIDPEEARKIFIAMYNQEPQIFWLDSIFYSPTGNEQPLAYRFTREEAQEMQKDIDKAASLILAQSEGMSDYERVISFHDYLVLHCDFSENDTCSSTIYGCLCVGCAQCEGYAFTFRYLCSLAGINCMTVTGSDVNGNTHAWNIVMLDGIWYNIDCTWDDPIIDPPDDTYIRRYYVLVSDSEILDISHFRNDEYFTYPSCYDSSRNYYSREGYLASSAQEGLDLLRRSAYEALSAGLRDAEVRFDNPSSYRSACTLIRSVNGIAGTVSPAISESGMTGIISTSKFYKYLNDDLYIIHIKMIPVKSEGELYE